MLVVGALLVSGCGQSGTSLASVAALRHASPRVRAAVGHQLTIEKTAARLKVEAQRLVVKQGAEDSAHGRRPQTRGQVRAAAAKLKEVSRLSRPAEISSCIARGRASLLRSLAGQSRVPEWLAKREHLPKTLTGRVPSAAQIERLVDSCLAQHGVLKRAVHSAKPGRGAQK